MYKFGADCDSSSAFPDAYNKHVTKAQKVCNAGW